MTDHPWTQSFPGAITVCDPEGIILEMNDRSQHMFREEGGAALIGTNVLDCHPEAARAKLKAMLQTQRANVYTIEKKGRKKLVQQTPWYHDGEYAGFVEMVIDMPDNLPHFVRG
ncbi:MAG TPA: diguanylate cyclase [Propionibacteriaceae bacterium]|nr:diguanylate cyclase [Propionibacteriaceae bacterium]